MKPLAKGIFSYSRQAASKFSILVICCLAASPALAVDYYHLDAWAPRLRLDVRADYSVGNGSTTPAADGTIDSLDDRLFFYNSAVKAPVNRVIVLGARERSIGSLTFGSNAGTTQIDRDSDSAGTGNGTALGVGAGGITVVSGAGAVTFGSLDTDRNQRVVVGAAEDFTINNHSANNLTFNRDFNGRTNNTTRTVTVAGSGNGDTIFKEIKIGTNGRNIAMIIDKSEGIGVVRFDGINTYTGATSVNAGTLIVNGSTVAGSAFRVSAKGTLGGTGTIGGTLSLAAGAKLLFNPASSDSDSALTINGLVTFGGFGVADIDGLDSSVPIGTYTIINGLGVIDFTHVSNVGVRNAYELGGGKAAFFESGGLKLVVSAVRR